MASLLLGPTGRTPDYSANDHQYANIKLAQTAVLVSRGGGHLHTVIVGVVGTLAKFYDVASGGTTDATTEIATISLAALTHGTFLLDVAFSQGLTCIVTGTAEIFVSFQGSQTTNPRNFGV